VRPLAALGEAVDGLDTLGAEEGGDIRGKWRGDTHVVGRRFGLGRASGGGGYIPRV